MVYVSIDDFRQKAALCRRLSRQEEFDCAAAMKAGDDVARARLIESYTPMVAGYVGRAPSHMQSLGLALYYLQALEKAVDSFDFTQEREPFSHHLSRWLRQATARYIVRDGSMVGDKPHI